VACSEEEMNITIDCYQVIKWAIIIVCVLVPIVGSLFIQRKQVISTTLLGLVSMMTAMFVGMMLLAAFLQFEQKEYVGVIIPAIFALVAMSLPFWVPRMLSGGDNNPQ